MKKSILFIALLFIGFTFVQAQSAAEIQAMEQLTKDFQAGKISLPEFQKRMEELTAKAGQQQYQQDQQQLQQRQQQQSQQKSGEVIKRTFSGATVGWPAASVFKRYGKTVAQPDVKIFANPYIQAPHSLTFSHRIQGEKLTIYIFRNFVAEDFTSTARADMNNNSMDLQSLRKYFENAFGGDLTWEDPTKKNVVPTVTNRGPHPYYTIEVSFNEYNSNTIVGGLTGIHETFLLVEIEPKQSSRGFSAEH